MVFAHEFFLRKALLDVIGGSMGVRRVNILYWEEHRIWHPKPLAFILAMSSLCAQVSNLAFLGCSFLILKEQLLYLPFLHNGVAKSLQ